MAEVAAKRGKNRKALKTISSNEANISAGKISSSFKENGEGLALVLSPQKSSKNAKSVTERSLAEELKNVQRRLEQLKIEKEKTEELLKQRDEMIKSKEEELESRAKEQEKLQKELKKLQKMKEFKPTMNLRFVKSLREKEQEKNEKEKNKKKNKDCPGKKKPSSAYVQWSKDQWNKVKTENPDAEFKEISNILGTKWKNLSAEEKKPYEEKYQQEREAYSLIIGKEKRESEAMKLLEGEQMQKIAMELLEQYLQFKQDAVNEEEKKTKKEKDPLKPKKPMSAFFLFINDRRAALLAEKKNVLEISKIASEEWKNMTEKDKAPYEEIAKKQKEGYNIQMEGYKQEKLEEAAILEKEEEEQKKIMKQEALQLLKKKEKTENIIKKTKETKKKQKEEKSSDPNKPKKPASSFFLFSKETRRELVQAHPDVGNSTLNAMISVKWKELSEEEKKIWNDKAAEGMAVYKREIEEYNQSIATNVASN
ncbi:uncharacterized protein A4U43_C01F26390 [Asparagus officinalis]|uniref:HMG box domain-containing protein n=1 Tax=Asparagus officinalis TaxID=4686 RepID=A0A5P1FWB9_ASPOF|nr:high mobility group B protein 6-like [Asparagus officinalis]ONK81200.1 uncharacterized protein A4U43_C01F26390 [Asparagus officinalis]